MSVRTDLAHEALSENLQNTSSGVKSTDREAPFCHIFDVEVTSSAASRRLEKPKGHYVTLELDFGYQNDPKGFQSLCRTLANELSLFLPKGDCLIAGLGNRQITADAIGPAVIRNILVTRHLVQGLPTYFKNIRKVSALTPGVLGTTGMESGDIIRGILHAVPPDFLLVIDALASASVQRLLTTIQITDTGLVPGSGVGNARAELTPDRLGLPVIALGVPTVIHAGTLVKELSGKETLDPACGDLVVTPKEIDDRLDVLAKLIGYGLNLALHPSLSFADIAQFLS